MRVPTILPAVLLLVALLAASLPATSDTLSTSVRATPAPLAPRSDPFKIHLEVPANVLANSNLVVQAFAEQNGIPASGTSVDIRTSFGSHTTGTADANGYAAFSLPVPFLAGAITVAATGTLGGSTATATAGVTVIIPNPFAKLTVWSADPVVAPGATATIRTIVTDRWGNPIPGAPLTVNATRTLGAIGPALATTGPTGMANFTYRAPSEAALLNRNLMDDVEIAVDVANTILPGLSTADYVQAVRNPVTNWTVLRIASINAGLAGAVPVLDVDPLTLLIPQTLTVTVQATDQSGIPLAGENVTASVSNSTALSVTPSNATTDSSGTASFQFGALTGTSTPVEVSFSVPGTFKSEDSLVILVANKSVSAHALWVDLGPPYGEPRGASTVTAHVFNETGAPANSSQVDLFSPYSTVGQPPRFVGGSFAAPYGSFWTGLTDSSGIVTTTTFWPESGSGAFQGAFLSDSLVSVEAGVGGFGPLGTSAINAQNAPAPPRTASDTWTWDTAVMARALPAVLKQSVLDKPEFSSDDNSGVLTWTFADSTGPVSGLRVGLYRGLGDLPNATKLGDFTTDTSGNVTLTYAEPKRAFSTPVGFTAEVTDPRYALGYPFGSVPFESVYPYIVDPRVLIVTGATQNRLVSAGQADGFSLAVTDIFGKGVPAASVSAGSAWNFTDSTGHTRLSVPTTAGINDITFVAWTGSGLSGSIRLGTYGGVGVLNLSALAISDTTPLKDETVYVNATVGNRGPVDALFVVDLTVDNATVASKAVTVSARGSQQVSFAWVVTDTAAHAVTIGSLTPKSVQATAPAVVAAGLDFTLAIAMAVGALILGLAVGALIGRRGRGGGRGRGPSPPSPRKEEEMPAEEELPPEL